jgi:regulator of extracellular matrix RemA (YlzA/DUF370 family)
MNEIFSKLDGAETVGLIAIVLGTIAVSTVVVTAIIVPMRAATRKAEIDAQLKQDLIAGNYSAADIERILSASSHESAEMKAKHSARR